MSQMLTVLWAPIRTPICWDRPCHEAHLQARALGLGVISLSLASCCTCNCCLLSCSQPPRLSDTFSLFSSPEWAHPGSLLQIPRYKEKLKETRPCPGLASVCLIGPDDTPILGTLPRAAEDPEIADYCRTQKAEDAFFT